MLATLRRIFIKRKNEKKRKPLFIIRGILKARFFEKIQPEKVEIFLKTYKA